MKQEIKVGQVWGFKDFYGSVEIKYIGNKIIVVARLNDTEHTISEQSLREEYTLQEPKPERKRMWSWGRMYSNCYTVTGSYYENHGYGHTKIEDDYLDFDLINGEWVLVQRGEE